MKNTLTIVKVGTGVVSNAERTKLDRDAIARIGDDICSIEGAAESARTARRLEHEGSLVLVTSGAVTAGKEKLRLNRQKFRDIRMQQTAAMVGNTTLFKLWEQATGIVVGHNLLTHSDLRDQDHWDNLAGVIANNLRYGVLSAFNEGDARSTEELQKTVRNNGREHKRFGDNDQLAAHLAINLGSFALAFAGQSTRVIFLTDTNGVMEDVDRVDSRIDYIAEEDINEVILGCITTDGVSNGGMLSKLLAAKDLVAQGINVTIGAGKEEYALHDLYNYEIGYGTHILAND
jgi:glutamate 5-kinase